MSRDLFQDPVRVGVLGCGNFMQNRILPASKSVKTLKFVALQKRNLSAALKVAEEFSVPSAVDSREELLASPEVEAVFIATPTHRHLEDALACASAGKMVICEKPIASNAEEGWKMVHTFEKARLPLLVGLSMRFRQTLVRARDIFQQGILGPLRNIRVRFGMRMPEDNWRRQPGHGSGVTRDVGVHLVDVIRFITGEEIVAVNAMPDKGFFDSGTDTTMTALLRLSSGAMGTIETSFDYPFHHGLEIIGEREMLIGRHCLRQANDPGESLCHVTNSGEHFIKLQAHNMYEEELRHIAEALGHHRSSCIDGREGAMTQSVIAAIYASATSGQQVEVETLSQCVADHGQVAPV